MRALPLMLLLAGCSGTAINAPSLLPRPIERGNYDEPTSTPVAVTPDASLDALVAEKSAAVEQGARGFADAVKLAEARVATARGAAEGSERWLDAQTAIADLGTARAATDGAVADLEALAIARSEKMLPPYPALDAALDKANAELSRENEIAARLSGTQP